MIHNFNINKSAFWGICLFSLLLVGACNKFDEINTNPDAAETVNASLLATHIILQNFKFQGKDAKAYLSDNAIAKYIAYGNETILRTQYNYLGSASFAPMTMLPDIKHMLDYAKQTQTENSYKGLAKFSEAFMFYRLTMQVGDIPLQSAGEGADGNIRPPYDKQEAVFVTILDDLKEADTLFAKGKPFDGDPTPYEGDPKKWRRAVNAFTLRVLLSLAPKADDDNLQIKSRFAAIVHNSPLLEENTGFLGLEYSSEHPHPMSGTNDLFTSRTMISRLIISNLKKLNDRRLFYFADPAPTKINGGGLSESDTAAYVGAKVSDNYDDLTAELKNNKYSLINSRYLKVQAGDPRIMISYAQQQLVLAEARDLGWISTGSAKQYYESGVKAALSAYLSVDQDFVHNNPITNSYIDQYFTGEAAFKSTKEEQLKQIWLQRYLLNFMQDPITSYFLHRRTNYPEFPANPATSLNVNNKKAIPVRWLYPQSEYNYNRENLTEALDRQFGGADEINEKIWLLK